MADNSVYLTGAEQIQANYEKYKDKFTDSNKELVNQETFLKLLVAEMSNQDPLEPTSNTEFISQLATFSSMQYMQDSSKYSMANYASSLAGKTVTATKMEGKKAVIKTGVVEKVAMGKNNTYTLTIDGETYSLSQITSVLDSNDKKTDSDDKTNTVTNSPLGDSISRAASLVGMYVTVKSGTGYVQGWVDSIRVKDGKITASVGGPNGESVGTDFPIEDITEVTVKYVTDTPQTPNNEDSGNTDDTTPDDGGDDVVEDLVESEA